MKTKTNNPELIEAMKGIVDRCGMTCPEVKTDTAGYYKGRLTMIYHMAKTFIPDDIPETINDQLFDD